MTDIYCSCGRDFGEEHKSWCPISKLRAVQHGGVSGPTPPTYAHTCECQGYHDGACTCEEGGDKKPPTYAQGQEGLVAAIKQAIERLEDIDARDGGPMWHKAKVILSGDIGTVLHGLKCALPIKEGMTELSFLVDRFLSWPLPESVCCDPCAVMHGWKGRIGTNLLTADEAKQMLEYVLADAVWPKRARLLEGIPAAISIIEEYLAVLDGGSVPEIGEVEANMVACDRDPYKSYVCSVLDRLYKITEEVDNV